jgi:LuxR family maltose regulon positive regulatory protein
VALETVGAGEQPALTRDVDRWGVLPSKLRPPRRRTDLIERTQLIADLVDDERPVVAVLAPAGYGKTTLVRSWSLVESRPVAWLTADPGDDDPVVFLRHAARALHQIAALDGVEALLASRAPNVAGRVLPALAAALADGRSPFVLVIDDVHRISSSTTADVIDVLVDNAPPGSRVVLVGRSAPALRLTRRALAGDVQEIRDDLLRLREDQAVALLQAGLPGIQGDDARSIARWSEGWPAGLRMAVIGLDGAPDRQRVDVIRTAASDRRLAEYLHEEFLQHLDTETRDFLTMTSILEQFDVDLCDAVLGHGDSSGHLRSLIAADNPFLVASDDERWWRYHHLFGDLLLSELRRRRPGVEAVLRRRAAIELSRRGFAEAAVAQALATGDSSFAARVIYEHVPMTLNLGASASIERWVAEMPRGAEVEPLAALSSGWFAYGRLAGDEIARWIAVVERAIDARPVDAVVRVDGLATLDLRVEVAALAMAAGLGGVTSTVERARIVREAGPDRSQWWHLAVLHDATARFALGEDALAALTDAEIATRGSDAAHVVALSNLAILHFLSHRDDTAIEAIDRATLECDAARMAEFPPLATFHAVRAMLAARRGRLDQVAPSVEQSEAALAIDRGFSRRGVVQTRLCLVEAALATGDQRRAGHHLARCHELLTLEPAALRLHAWARRLADRHREARAGGAALTDAERRVLGELASHRTLAEIAERLYVSRNTVKTQTIAIYRKLGVSGRSAAVDRGRELHLIDD